MSGKDYISSVLLANTILEQCFSFTPTRKTTTVYDLAQYVTMLDIYMSAQRGVGTGEQYCICSGIWMPYSYYSKFSTTGSTFDKPVIQYIPTASHKHAQVSSDMELQFLAQEIIMKSHYSSQVKRNEWINQYAQLQQISPDHGMYLLELLEPTHLR
mgnify:CR=1 FL=1